MQSNNTVIIIIVTLIVAAGAYWYFFTGTGNQPPLTAGAPEQNSAQTKFKVLVSELQPITFDTSIFSEPSFMALSDLATPVAPETLGRLDPFAGIPGVIGK
ncbi:hypothetical protein KGQ72_02400 [Patescibacteria group bacterium]|nr:hypothetical protein [Patescibacteria group bacterium]